jgi:hypothetical protein
MKLQDSQPEPETIVDRRWVHDLDDGATESLRMATRLQLYWNPFDKAPSASIFEEGPCPPLLWLEEHRNVEGMRTNPRARM